ncbi:MAG: hypothetical protein RMK99_16840, partial [Anaerolineales bacterium]|nr:hypothetical protein [Anaerolineales bacterium]
LSKASSYDAVGKHLGYLTRRANRLWLAECKDGRVHRLRCFRMNNRRWSVIRRRRLLQPAV